MCTLGTWRNLKYIWLYISWWKSLPSLISYISTEWRVCIRANACVCVCAWNEFLLVKENYFHTFTYAEQSHFTILRYFLHSGFKAICISGSHIFRKYRNNLGSLEIYINVNSFVRKSSLVQIPLSAVYNIFVKFWAVTTIHLYKLHHKIQHIC